MPGFVFRLIPPRPGFAGDMSPAERATMIEHVAYWSALAEQGRALAFGPVDDPAGPYGIGIILAASRSEAEALRDGDPAVRSPHGFRTEIAPMLRLVGLPGALRLKRRGPGVAWPGRREGTMAAPWARPRTPPGGDPGPPFRVERFRETH